MNLYAYVFNNSINKSDPFGQCAPELIGLGALIGLLFLFNYYGSGAINRDKDKSSHQDTQDPEALTKRQQGMGNDMVEVSRDAKAMTGMVGGTSGSGGPAGFPSSGPEVIVGWSQYGLDQWGEASINQPPQTVTCQCK